MGIDWAQVRFPRSISEAIDDHLKKDKKEGKWKPIARSIFKENEEIKEEVMKEDPDLMKELEEDSIFEDEDTDKFHIFD